MLLVASETKDSLGETEPYYGLKVCLSSGHTPVSQSIKFSCQMLRHTTDMEHVVHDAQPLPPKVH